MLAKTHLLSALVVASLPLVFGYETSYDTNAILYFLAVSFGALIPDIDEHKSYIGKRLLFISFPIKTFFGHRTITHNLILPLFGVILSIVWVKSFLWFGFFLGVIVHILGDAMTGNVKGALLPIRDKFYILPKKMIFSVGGPIEYVMLYTLVLALIAEHSMGFI